MRIGRHIEIHRKRPETRRSARVGRLFIVASRDRYQAPYIEIGVGTVRDGVWAGSGPHDVRLTLGAWSVPPRVEIIAGSLNIAAGRLWFEAR